MSGVVGGYAMKKPSDMTVKELAEVALRYWEHDRKAAAAACARIAAVGGLRFGANAAQYRQAAEYIRKH